MHLLRGDLDWIVIKSLEKDRARRYATANGLAMDVQRYLANEPIVARPPSKLYRVQKLIRRNQLTFAAGAGVAIALLAGLSVSTWQFVEKSRGYRRLREAEGEQRRLLKETQRAQEEEAGLRQKAEAEVYTADMNLALQAWREGNMERARALLRTYLPEPGKADLRGFEWRYLWNLFQDESQRSFTNFSGEVRSLALSPDGRLLAAGGHNVVRLIEIAITQEIDELRNPIEWVNGGAFSPTSKDVFATAGAEGLVKLWNLRTKELVATLVGYPSGINSITFSPNGKRLAAAGWGTTLQVWDVERQTSLWTRSTRYPTQVAVFTPDGSALVSGGGKVGNALVWEVETGKEMAPLPPEHKLWLESCAFSPDGTTLATGSIDSQIILWDFATRRRRAILLGHLGPVLSVAFSPDGNRVVSGGADETVRVWDAASGRQIALLRGHEGPVGAVVFSPDGTTVFSGSGDSTVKVWRPSLRSESQIVKARGTCITSVAFSPSGTLLAFVDYDEALTTLCDVASAGAIADFPGSSLGGYSVAFSPSGEMLAAGSEDYLVRLWHVASRNRLCVFTNDFPAGSICFSPDNRVVAAAGKTLAVRKERNTLAFWDIASRRKLVRLAGAAPEACVVAWANDGRFVAVGYWRGEVQVWDFVKDKVVSKFNEHKGAVFQVAFSSDGRYLASVGDDAGVVLYDLSAQRAFKLSGHTSWVLSVAFAPDDKTLVTTGVDGTIRFWNITTREIALILRDHVGPVGGVAFTLKGDRMASSGMDGTVRLWTAASLPRAP
jgi:WD40 repeat protein